MKPQLPEPRRVAARLNQISEAGIYSNFGPQVQELEAQYAEFLGTSAEKVVSVANATLGIQGAVSISTAATWVVPSFTFAATPAAVLGAGRRLEWADVSMRDWWAELDGRLIDGTQGAVSVAPFGTTFDLSRWDEIGEDSELVIDAAASLGSSLPALQRLPAAWSVVFSLHATKVLPAGEGGIVVFGDPARARAFRAWANFGFDGRRESIRVGTNAKMSELTAAVGLCSLEDWEEERAEWCRAQQTARVVEAELGLKSIPLTEAQLSPYWIVAFENIEVTNRVERTLSERGIGTRRWWFPACHAMPGFQGDISPVLPNTDEIAPRVLGLPMFRGMTSAEFEEIRAALEVALL